MSAPVFTKRGDFWIYTGAEAHRLACILDVAVVRHAGVPGVSFPDHGLDDAADALVQAGVVPVFQIPGRRRARS